MDAAGHARRATALERGTRRKLAGVIVSIAELGLDAVTGEDGTFYFHGVAPGQLPGARGRSEVRSASSGRSRSRSARRSRSGCGCGRAAATRTRRSSRASARSARGHASARCSASSCTSVPGTFGDPIRVIQTLPGMQRAPFGLGLLLVRGSTPTTPASSSTATRCRRCSTSSAGPSIFNAEMLESIDLYPGGFPARFGRHHGGVVALELRPTKSDGVHGSAKVDFIDTGGYVRAPITKDLSVAFAGRRSYIDAFLGFVLPEPAAGRAAHRDAGLLRLRGPPRLQPAARTAGSALFAIGSSDTLHVLDKDADAQRVDEPRHGGEVLPRDRRRTRARSAAISS